MELFGEKLREVRESKKYSIEQVARETRISKRYLIALENEDFQAFPGETYLIGFLRSYAEYLDLEPDHYVNLYKNIKIQEQPIPFDELLETGKKTSPLFIALTIFLGIALVACIGFILFLTVFSQNDNGIPPDESVPVTVEEDAEELRGKTYIFNDEVMTEWFYKDDVIVIPIGDKEFPITIMVAKEQTDLKVVDKPVVLSMGNEKAFDLNTDGKVDISLVLNDYRESEAGDTVNIGIYKANVSKLVYTEEEIEEQQKPEPEIVDIDNENRNETDEQEPVIEVIEETTTTVPFGPYELISKVKIKEDTRTVITETEEAEPFVLSIIFRESCLFRYIIDGKTRDHRYFSKNDPLNLPATREILMYIQNAYSVKATIAGKSVVMGKAGQVVTKIVYWVKDEENGKYRLEIASVY